MADDTKPEETGEKTAEERMQEAIAAKKGDNEADASTATAESSAPVEGGTQLIDNVKVHSPFKTYFDGPAYSISAKNATGPFDILFGHKNFMSLLEPCDIIVRHDRGEEKITIEHGVLHSANNTVVVFLDV